MFARASNLHPLLVSAVVGVTWIACGPQAGSVPEKVGVQRARVGAECFELEPAAIDFGATEQDCSTKQSFMLRNVCASSVTLSEIRVDSPTGEFALTQAPAIGPDGRSVAAGEELKLSAAFEGTTAGTASGELTVRAIDDGVTSERSWALSADTLALEQHTDVFVMPDEREQSDVLVVIDNGPELAPLLSSVREGLRQFAFYAHVAGYDARFAFTFVAPTTATSPGALVQTASGQTFVDVRNPDWEAEVDSVLDALEVAPSEHASFDAAISAWENGAFMRDGAAKAVLFLSGTGDYSKATVFEALSRMRDLTASSRRRWAFTVNAVAPFGVDSMCSVTTPEDGQFAWAVSATNGVRESICTPDWEKSLESLGKVYFGWRKEFLLTEAPDLTRGTPSATIDGVEVESVDSRGATVWTYDSVRNALLFEPMYVPERGQTLEVTYPLLCGVSL